MAFTFLTSRRQKRLKTLSLGHVWLPNVLRATIACTFSMSGRPKVVRTSEMCFAPQQRALFQPLNFQKCAERGVSCTIWLGNVLRATTACTFSASQLPKVRWTCYVLYILTWKCASRYNSVHIFSFSTSKSALNVVCFVHFDLEMGFAPQRRALFRQLNLKKWSEPGVFCAFWLGSVLRATTACTFSTAQLEKVVRTWCVLYILTWKRASRHNGVQFFISHLTIWLRTCRFSEVTFRPSGATNHWKNTVNRDFPTFSRTCIFFLRTLSLLCSSHFFSSPLWLFPPLLFHLSILSEDGRSLTYKLQTSFDELHKAPAKPRFSLDDSSTSRNIWAKRGAHSKNFDKVKGPDMTG